MGGEGTLLQYSITPLLPLTTDYCDGKSTGTFTVGG